MATHTQHHNRSGSRKPPSSLAAVLKRMDADSEVLKAQLADLQRQLELLNGSKLLLSSYMGATEVSSTPAPRKQPVAHEVVTPSPDSRPHKRTSTPGRRQPSKRRPTSRKKEARPYGRGKVVVDYLVTHGEPRSAAEVTEALEELYPEQVWKRPAVRQNLEQLVAKGQVNRTAQGRSVFYTAASNPHSQETTAHAAVDPTETAADRAPANAGVRLPA